LQYPITYRGDTDVPIWPLAAFSGSTIVPLMPIDKEHFESFHNFRISEIEQLVSYIEDTGKIQFVLVRKPTDYYKLDFLEPIFKRLRPLLDHLTIPQLDLFVKAVHSAGLEAALAGSLRKQDLATLYDLDVDIAGFRGAVCTRSDRNSGEITSPLVADLVTALKQLKTQRP